MLHLIKNNGYIIISNDEIDKYFLQLYINYKKTMNINKIKDLAKKEYYKSLKMKY